jgi:hypothetical protein
MKEAYIIEYKNNY